MFIEDVREAIAAVELAILLNNDPAKVCFLYSKKQKTWPAMFYMLYFVIRPATFFNLLASSFPGFPNQHLIIVSLIGWAVIPMYITVIRTDANISVLHVPV